MFPSTALLSLLLAAVSSATPIRRDSNKVTLQFAHQVNALCGLQNLAEIDRDRAIALVNNAASQKGGKVSVDVTNTAVTYTAQVDIGSPPTKYTLLIDTGSSNTWVKGDKYIKTKTSKKTDRSVHVSYGSGSFSGMEYDDTVTLAPGLTIKSQSIGVASNATGFDEEDGILGIGPVDLTNGTVSKAPTVPTVTDNLFKAGAITSDAIGIFYSPAAGKGGGSGELTWGGVDTTKIVGAINYVPITQTAPAKRFWGVDQTVTYKGKTIVPLSAGIIDTGTTLVLLATDYFRKYQEAVGGGDVDKATGLIKITSEQFSKLEDLDFKIGQHTYTLTPNAQIWPRSLNTDIGGEKGSIYLIVSDLGTASGQGLDFINGYAFLERFYSVYDTTNHRVGFATTKYTKATTN